MFKLREVTKLLNCSLSNVYALIQQGKLAVVATGAGGKGFRVSEEELLRFKREQQKLHDKSWPVKAKIRPDKKQSPTDWF